MALSTGEYLNRHNIDEMAIQIAPMASAEADHHAHLAQSSVQSTENYLNRRGIGRADFVADEARSRLRYALNDRVIALWSLIVAMAISAKRNSARTAPFWLMALVSLPAFGIREAYSEPMENALLVALVSGCAGLCYVITRNLLPPSKGD
ncbi:MAG: hypothetical protein KME13_00455 [Myxacorys californica WJT36-NPBG1]|jgi:hypothetical protein|nr:hypothetical protein [Myxacorys californica WJT36-NPBG1]